MILRKIMSIGLLWATLLSAGGCALQYNGAFGLKSKDRKTIDAYQKLKQKQEDALVDANAPAVESSEEAARGDVALDDGSMAPLLAPPDGMTDLDVAIVEPIASTNAVHALRLYGTLPRSGAALESPLDGTGNIQQVTFSFQGSDFDPDIDYAGRQVVYASTQHRENADIYVKKSDGTAVTQMTNDPARDEMPTFSPDGRQVAFASNRTGNWDLFLIDVSGGQPVQITNDSSDEIHPSFSPDGTQLVYCSFGERSGQWELVVIDVANPARKKFLGFGLFPSWSPDGDKIVYQRAREWGTRWFSVWTLDLIDGEAQRFTEVVACTNAAAITPTWSPDGVHIVFCTVVNPGEDKAEDQQPPVQADVWIVRADGTGRVNLTNSPFANLQPAWGGDGSIVFVSDRARNGRESIWAIRPTTALRTADASRNRAVRSASAAPTGPPATEVPAGAATSSDMTPLDAPLQNQGLAVTPVEP